MPERGKGDLKLVKEHNKRLVMNMIENRYATTRAAIARASGLSPTTVSTLINELVAEGLVTELGPTPSQRGRRPVMYQVNQEAGFVVGADVGSHVLTILVADLRGSIIKEFQRDILDQTGQELVNTLKDSISEAVAASEVAQNKIIGVGVASPGLVDHLTGTVIRANNVEWFDLPLKGILQHELGLPVQVENMNRVAALGEYERLEREVRSFLYINIGRGVGAGLIVNGRILQGSTVSAGELGHLVMVKNGEMCNCGARGCLETLVSAKAIERQGRMMLKQSPQSLLHRLAEGDPARINLEMIAQAARGHDPLAVNIFAQAAEWMGLAVAGMINILNPDIIMLGGRVVRAAEEIIMSKIRTVAKENSLPALFEMVTFMQPKLGPLSAAMGAIAAVRQEFGQPYRGHAVNP